MVASRRRFLFLCAAAAPGLWLAQVGLIRLPGRMVQILGGNCSFCGKPASRVARLAGVTGQPYRICDECIGLCLDILAEELKGMKPPLPPVAPRDGVPPVGAVDELEALLWSIRSEMPAPEKLERAKELLDGLARSEPQRVPDFSCSFCHRPRREVAKLISGPRVFICDACVADAAALSSDVLVRA
jgi:hypothetical protein